ncbi:hypothetical protein AGLY_002876 [Aphis glycines]|uniref:Uncharacterized protein n=1 Tax=Aphis glycines TaxID=307491 RepID=A0A6G0U1J3_APHGL|nr:hypothetical protein AGLY_002876 [Aphis glycines]
MFKLVFTTIILGFVSTVQCGPMPQYLIDGGQNQRQDVQNHAIDRFTTRLVGNSKIRENYLNCFLDDGPCSPEANNIKPGMVPDAIQNECAHCTELQKRVIEKMMCYLNNHQPDILREVAAKFDPSGEYMKQFINNLERNGNEQFLNPNLFQNQPQPNPNQSQQNPNQPQSNPNQSQSNPNQPQSNSNQPHLHQNQPQSNPNQPHLHQNQPQFNPNQPQLNPNQPQSNPNQQHLHQNQPQSNLNQPHLHQHQTQQNPNQPHQHQHQQQQQPKQNQYQPQQYQNQPQQHQHEQLKATEFSYHVLQLSALLLFEMP